MKVIYIADDGKEFDNEYDCESYEWKLNHTHLNEICFYDKDGNKLNDAYSENTYNNAERIIVPNENAVKESLWKIWKKILEKLLEGYKRVILKR